MKDWKNMSDEQPVDNSNIEMLFNDTYIVECFVRSCDTNDANGKKEPVKNAKWRYTN